MKIELRKQKYCPRRHQEQLQTSIIPLTTLAARNGAQNWLRLYLRSGWMRRSLTGPRMRTPAQVLRLPVLLTNESLSNKPVKARSFRITDLSSLAMSLRSLSDIKGWKQLREFLLILDFHLNQICLGQNPWNLAPTSSTILVCRDSYLYFIMLLCRYQTHKTWRSWYIDCKTLKSPYFCRWIHQFRNTRSSRSKPLTQPDWKWHRPYTENSNV